MKKASEVFKSIRFAKLDPKHDVGHKGGSTDDEEHGAVSEVEWNQQLQHQKKRAMQEEEQLDEISKKTLGSYVSKAASSLSQASASSAHKRTKASVDYDDNIRRGMKKKDADVHLNRGYDSAKPDIQRVLNRVQGIKKAASRLSKEEVEMLDEKNAPTNPSLWSRAKALARSKFDVYPSAYANGWAAKWYKSKGGGWKTVSEETLDEGKMKSMATDREEDERLSKPPFDKPYSTVKKVVTDKSGAKHGPMSRARDLARKGTRAASIVREAADKAKAKKKEKKASEDTFQPEPVLNTNIIRND